MITDNVTMVYFSPTGTTRTVLSGIARGMGCDEVQTIDITLPQGREEPLRMSASDLLLIGVPVYMGRVPALIHEWLVSLRLHQTPTVCVVVYGNRVYEDALLELTDIVRGCGGIPIAGGAFIGEHSFSTTATPTAAGRPDAGDMQVAETFGREIREKIRSVPDRGPLSEVNVPGTHTYRGSPALWTVDFIAVSDRCRSCGLCAEVCPAGAIDPGRSSSINQEACITCCACIRRCPVHAREMKPGLVMEASERLSTLYPEPKVPEYYL